MFAPLEEWQAWLEELRVMDQDDQGVKWAIEEAERMVAELEGPAGNLL